MLKIPLPVGGRFGEKETMIGFYDYTVILTYASLASAICGMGLSGTGHPILATICLLFCGMCDMFDGKVARTKKNRTEEEKSFGIQIDSLCDIVAFGVLPAVILLNLCKKSWYAWVIAALYVLAGLIRLAYFNVTEELRQKETDACRKTYAGLPITASALIFPLFYCIMAVYCQRVYGDIVPYRDMFFGTWRGLTLCGVAAVTGLCFILPFRIRKPQTKELFLMLFVGLLMAAVLILVRIL